jgi:phospholipase/lecithinase/hemolysin
MRLHRLIGPALFTAGIPPAVATSNGSSFEYLVVFGDSYSDDGRGNYFWDNGAKQPPVGTNPPESGINWTGGLVWGQYVGNYTGATVYDYAIGGSTCTNTIIPKFNPFYNATVPSVLDEMIPAYENDTETALYADVTAENAVYGLWIGTNDLGVDAFLMDTQVPNTNLTTYVDCLWSVFDHIYTAGGRRFVILNNNALQLAPVFRTPEQGGTGNSLYWGDKENYNMTEYNQKMMEYTVMANRLISDGAPLNLLVHNRWPGASFGVFDVNGLVTDIFNNPQKYLEAPYNATWYYNDCPSAGCPADRLLDSYLWYDALHPSNKTSKLCFLIYLSK